VSEGGEHGYHAGVDKFAAMQAVLTKFDKGTPAEPPLPPRKAYGTVNLTERVAVLDALAALGQTGRLVKAWDSPPTMESAGCMYGFALYHTTISRSKTAAPLAFSDLKDRVQVFVDGAYVGNSYRVGGAPPVSITTNSGSKLQLLLENMGRINFGHGMDHETKGLGNVTLDGEPCAGWSLQCLPFEPEQVAAAPFKPAAGPSVGPTLFKGTFTVDAPADTFVYMDGWTKGAVWVNGFALGRYWQPQGPQQTLYLPGPKLVVGENTLIVLELENGTADASTQLVEQPMLQKPPSSARCDPTVGGKAGAAVKMVTENPKFAHQQQWSYAADTGLISLQAVPSLCMAVEPGCPHQDRGCIVLATCDPKSPGQVFDFKPAAIHPGADHLVLRQNSQCLDIFAHDSFEGAPLGTWSCNGEFDQANEWWSYDKTMGHITSFQAGALPGPYVVTVCTSH